MPNILTIRGLKEAEITHDAQLIKTVPIDDTEKANEKVLSYDQPSDKIVYVPKCPEIVIKAIQHTSITIPAVDLSAQVLINEVDLDNTFLIWGGYTNTGIPSTQAFTRIDLIDSTHVRAIRNTTGNDVTVNFCVIECTAGIKSIQRGTIVVPPGFSNDDTISEVDTDKAFVAHMGVSTDDPAYYSGHMIIYLLDSTTVRAYHGWNLGTVTINYEVVEFI
jgi:hypothetical protein